MRAQLLDRQPSKWEGEKGWLKVHCSSPINPLLLLPTAAIPGSRNCYPNSYLLEYVQISRVRIVLALHGEDSV